MNQKTNQPINKRKIGIIGYGAFGKFIHEICNKYFPKFEVRVSSRSNEVDNELFFELNDVCKSDFVFPCIPISKFEETIKLISDKLGDKTIILKSVPSNLIHSKYLKMTTT